ncbi:MAG TPA: urea carboxylase [Steroidobacteraceae bacterium]|nr:urea carboxylase [Steroidobacteraceae bacterium]
MFDKVLIANRGAIACRIQRTLRRLRVAAVAVYSEADRGSLHVRNAEQAVLIGGASAADSYLRSDRILEAAIATGAQAIHPGYGFLSENAQFAEECACAGIAFVGPTPRQIRDFGLKHTARALAAANGLPLLPGSDLLLDLRQALLEAQHIGYPVMLKSTAGGGGIGMQQCASEAELCAAFDSVRRIAGSNFRDSGVFLEKYLARARHIEVQLFGNGDGQVIALGERDCSMQRRNQKVIEETPAPGLEEHLRSQLCEAAVRLGSAVQYRSAGTVEFIVDADRMAGGDPGAFYFLEVNTRLQVEHGVTEAVTGVDLVAWMLQLAAGEPPDLGNYRHAPSGVAIQARVYAEDPARGFRPSSGLLTEVHLPDTLRVDAWIDSGTEVPAFYDPMLAKLIAHAPTRDAAIEQLDAALGQTRIYGIETNLEYLRTILRQPGFRRAGYSTRFLNSLPFSSHTLEVLQPGTHTTLQDWPGRLHYWDVGVPPSGPMDPLAFRLGNRLLGNPDDCAALELTVTGPTLKFGCDALIALTGAGMRAELDGVQIEFWRVVPVAAGSVLKLGAIEAGAGQRSYLALRGGFDVPRYMGSRATFVLGQFGGHAGRALRTGDVLRIAAHAGAAGADSASLARAGMPPGLRPSYGQDWQIAVIYGPHGAPDFFTEADIDTFFATDWQVHYNSSRTGVRLIGPRPHWARHDGGEAGLHPSNIHDNAYAVGAIDFTGDMPVILGPDGPSLGGFVCPATITLSDRWKVGQLRPGDRLRFQAVTAEQAHAALLAQDEAIRSLAPPPVPAARLASTADRPAASRQAILDRCAATATRPAVCYRQSGEDNVLIEYGEPTLDLALRFRIQALLDALQADPPPGVIDLTPGVRSLQVHFDCRRTSRERIMHALLQVESALAPIDDIEVAGRIVHLPLSWDDPATRLAIERYMQSVRADAPWCPSNIEFIRRINGLDSVEEVRRIVFEASYLVMGLGDVYLGAPVATPLDPRHRLVTTKYNPARTWTPENAVGIGGAYLCVYGMEGPGGYQFVGRTVQMWNRYRQTAQFREGKRWLLRFFDQLRFYPVSAEELLRLRAEFPYGKASLRIEPTTLRLRDYRQFLAANSRSIAAFKARQQAAFDAERERWRSGGREDDGNIEPPADGAAVASSRINAVPDGCIAVSSPVTGSVWQLHTQVGARAEAGTALIVIEAMKMEIAVQAEQSGTVVELRCQRGQPVSAGETLLILRT